MGYSVVPQMLRLTRDEPQGKHRANGLIILEEMLEERATKSETFDRAFSYLNEYGNGTLGSEAWDKLCEEANAYKIIGKTKRGEDFQRSLPQKSTIAIAVIYKLPEEYSAQLSVEENAKFYRDSEEVIAELYPMLFAKKNERYFAIHRDEGLVHADTKEDANEHEHKIYVPKDENENYCGTLADSKMFANICKKYPRMMRERGWDFDDLDTTDWDRYKYDSDYRAERKQKAKENGLSVNKYGKKMSAKEAKKQALERVKFVESVEALKQKIECANSRMELANVIADGIDAERKELDKEKQKFTEEKALQDKIVQEKVEQEVARERAKMQSKLQREREQMQQEQQEFDERNEALELVREVLRQQQVTLEEERDEQKETLEHEREALKQERIQTQQLFAKRMRGLNAYKSELRSAMDKVNAFAESDKNDAVNYDLETWCRCQKYANGVSIYDKYLSDKESRRQRAKDTSALVDKVLSNADYNDTDYQK